MGIRLSGMGVRGEPTRPPGTGRGATGWSGAEVGEEVLTGEGGRWMSAASPGEAGREGNPGAGWGRNQPVRKLIHERVLGGVDWGVGADGDSGRGDGEGDRRGEADFEPSHEPGMGYSGLGGRAGGWTETFSSGFGRGEFSLGGADSERRFPR